MAPSEGIVVTMLRPNRTLLRVAQNPAGVRYVSCLVAGVALLALTAPMATASPHGAAREAAGDFSEAIADNRMPSPRFDTDLPPPHFDGELPSPRAAHDFQALVQSAAGGPSQRVSLFAEVVRQIKAAYPSTETLFASPNTDYEATIEQHSAAVLQGFEAERLRYPVDADALRRDSGIRNLDGLMVATLALHDIGKPLGRRAQHEHTAGIMEHVMPGLGFNDAEITLALALIDNDTLGTMVKSTSRGASSAHAATLAFADLQANAKAAGVSVSDFYGLQASFYVADATYYSFIRASFARDARGNYVPNPRQRSGEAWERLRAQVAAASVNTPSPQRP